MNAYENNSGGSLQPIAPKDKPHKKFLSVVFKGLIMLLPVIILVVVFLFLLRLVLNILTPISVVLTGGGEPGIFMYFLSFIILLFIFYGAGLFISTRMGNVYFNEFEKAFLYQIPLYSTFRETIRQFTGAKELPFQRVALVDIFNTGTLMTAFVIQRSSDDRYTVYVPTAPNPANGNVYHVTLEQMQFVNVKLESALRSVVSMGAGSKSLFDNIEDLKKDEDAMPL